MGRSACHLPGSCRTTTRAAPFGPSHAQRIIRDPFIKPVTHQSGVPMDHTCAFFGLGRVGLPQALVAADSGLDVFGIDVDEQRIESLAMGVCPFTEPSLQDLLDRHLGTAFHPLPDREASPVLSRADFIVITVGGPYPSGPHEAFMTLSRIVDRILSTDVRPGVTIVLRPTVEIGTTDRLREHIELKHDLTEGIDFHLAYVPERLAEGNAVVEERTLPKIIGTYSDAAYERTSSLFSRVGGRLIKVSKPRTAETCKLIDNSFRSTLFAFANDLALLAEGNGIDALEVITGCNQDYPRNAIPAPGPVSGYCLGKDPYILEESFGASASGRGFGSLWYYGRKANDALADHCADVLRRTLGKLKRHHGARVLVMGMSFKSDVDDYRLSFGIDLVDVIRRRLPDAKVRIYDSHLGANSYTRMPPSLNVPVEDRFDRLSPEVFRDIDAVVIAARAPEIAALGDRTSLGELLVHAQPGLVIYDCWNIWRPAVDIEGVSYFGLGFRNPCGGD
ncbi:nucleotide sugar dehydrogenase [Mycobacterium dioxanotrophicus]|uniref:nucleotide sugar dehydrogenase n=1 Tax=Mycobacterium dioxanotrophicus TaxID=482462 RepID=UPI0012F9A7A3|nr:nucleotide sugar dehydrogenase [Mycobacterium dioxanotrophicus]